VTDGSQRAIGLVVKLPFATREEFLARYGGNISLGGIYLRAKAVKPPGTSVTLDLRLASGERLIHANARVEFNTGLGGVGVSGMGLRFLSVDQSTQQFLDSAVATLPHAQSLQPPIPHGVGEAQFGPAGPSANAVASPATALNPGGGVTPGDNGASPGGLERASAPAPVESRAPFGSGSLPASTPRSSPAVALSAPPFEAPAEEPARTGPIVGIDLGTTSLRAAYVRGGKPLVLASADGYNTVPSILALDARGKLAVGRQAKGQMLTHPRLAVSGAKRLVGRQFESPMVQSARGRVHHEIASGEEGEAAVKLADRVYPLEQVCALILRDVRELAQSHLGQPISRAVITVPACFNAHQRRAVREAGRLAGVCVERIVTEPVAAALAFGYGRELRQRILVYDLGGGTFDASILEVNGNEFQVISTGGDSFLGGIDFDDAIVGWLVEELEKAIGKKFEGDGVAMQRLHDAAERAKCALSERGESRVRVPFVAIVDGHPVDLDVTLTREKLFQLTEGLVNRTLQICQDVLSAKNLEPKDIDEVILVGAQSRSPLVRYKVQELFGKPPAAGVHPDEAVALGAGLLAVALEQANGLAVTEVLPMSIGVGLPGGSFKPILERNTRLPAKHTYVVRTSRDDQTELELTLFEGDAAAALENEYLGTLTLSGLTKGPRGKVGIALTFDVSEEGLLKVTALEPRTGREVSSAFSTRDSPEALRAKLQQVVEQSPATENQAATVPVQAPAVEDAGERTASEGADSAEKSGGFKGWVRRVFGGG
jgi:molecular chaperone DnaK